MVSFNDSFLLTNVYIEQTSKYIKRVLVNIYLTLTVPAIIVAELVRLSCQE